MTMNLDHNFFQGWWKDIVSYPLTPSVAFCFLRSIWQIYDFNMLLFFLSLQRHESICHCEAETHQKPMTDQLHAYE